MKRKKGTKYKKKSVALRWNDMEKEIAIGWGITYAAMRKEIDDKLYRKMKK